MIAGLRWDKKKEEEDEDESRKKTRFLHLSCLSLFTASESPKKTIARQSGLYARLNLRDLGPIFRPIGGGGWIALALLVEMYF